MMHVPPFEKSAPSNGREGKTIRDILLRIARRTDGGAIDGQSVQQWKLRLRAPIQSSERGDGQILRDAVELGP